MQFSLTPDFLDSISNFVVILQHNQAGAAQLVTLAILAFRAWGRGKDS